MNTKWALIFGGIIEIIFGLFLLLSPNATISFLLILFGIYAVVFGVALIIGAFTSGAGYRWWLGIGGTLSLLLGLGALFYQTEALVFLVYLIAFRAIVVGVSEFVTSITMRKEIKGEFILGLLGVLNVLFGIFLLFYPGIGAATLIFILGWYSLIAGAILVFRGLFSRTEIV